MKNASISLLIVRLSVGILMLFHGVGKIRYGISGIEKMLAGKGIPEFIAYAVPKGSTWILGQLDNKDTFKDKGVDDLILSKTTCPHFIKDASDSTLSMFFFIK